MKFISDRNTLVQHALSEVAGYKWRYNKETKENFATVWLRDGTIIETTDALASDYETTIVPHTGAPVKVLTWYYDAEDDTFEVEEHVPIAWRVPHVAEDYALVQPVFVSPFHAGDVEFAVVLPNGKVSEMDTLAADFEQWKEAKLAFCRQYRKTKAA